MTDESQIPCAELFSTNPPREWDPEAARDDMYGRIERLEEVALDQPVPEGIDRHIRIEALRAAAQVWAGRGAANALMGSDDEVLRSAKQFAAYLESGE